MANITSEERPVISGDPRGEDQGNRIDFTTVVDVTTGPVNIKQSVELPPDEEDIIIQLLGTIPSLLIKGRDSIPIQFQILQGQVAELLARISTHQVNPRIPERTTEFQPFTLQINPLKTTLALPIDPRIPTSLSCYIDLFAKTSSGRIFLSTNILGPFEIKDPDLVPPTGLEIKLNYPIPGSELPSGQSSLIKYIITTIPSTRRDSLIVTIKTKLGNNSYTPPLNRTISTNEEDTISPWNIPVVTERTLFYIKISTQGLEKEFPFLIIPPPEPRPPPPPPPPPPGGQGPINISVNVNPQFRVAGARIGNVQGGSANQSQTQSQTITIEGDGDGEEEITIIEPILTDFKLPKRGWIWKDKNIPQFASDLSYNPDKTLWYRIDNIPTLIGRLEKIQKDLVQLRYPENNPRKYQQFLGLLEDIQSRKGRFLELKSKARQEEIRNLGNYAFEELKQNATFQELYRRRYSHYRSTPEFPSSWEELCKNPEIINLLLENRNSGLGVRAIAHLYNFFDFYYEYFNQLGIKFEQMQSLLHTIKSDLHNRNPSTR